MQENLTLKTIAVKLMDECFYIFENNDFHWVSRLLLDLNIHIKNGFSGEIKNVRTIRVWISCLGGHDFNITG